MPEPRSPFKPQDFNPPTLKAASNAMLEDAIRKMSNDPRDIFDGMQHESTAPVKPGKRIYLDKVNQSSH